MASNILSDVLNSLANVLNTPVRYAMANTKDNHYKYYIVSIKTPSNPNRNPYGYTVTIDYGKINKPPKHAIYQEGCLEDVARDAAKLVRDKMSKGYEQIKLNEFNLVTINKEEIMVTELNYHVSLPHKKTQSKKKINEKKQVTNNNRRFNTLII